MYIMSIYLSDLSDLFDLSCPILSYPILSIYLSIYLSTQRLEYTDVHINLNIYHDHIIYISFKCKYIYIDR